MWSHNLLLIKPSVLTKQRLNAGDDPATAFVLSSEAAVAGAESTKDMQAQVNLKSDTQYGYSLMSRSSISSLGVSC